MHAHDENDLGRLYAIEDKDLLCSEKSLDAKGDDASSYSQSSVFVTPPSKPPHDVSSTAETSTWSLSSLRAFSIAYLQLYQPLDTFYEKAVALGSAAFAIIAGLPLPIIGYIFGQIVNEFPPENHALHERLVQLLAVAMAYFLVTTIYTVGFGLTAESVSIKLRKKLLECLLFLDQAYLDTHEIDVDGFLTEKIDTIRAGCCEKVGIFLQSISYFFAAAGVGFVLNAKLTSILLACVVPAFALSFFCLAPAVSRNTRAASSDAATANGLVEGALRAIRVIQAFDLGTELCQRHAEHVEVSSSANIKKAAFVAVQSGSAYFVSYAANALAFYLGSRFASDGNAGSVYAVVFLILDASFIVGQFSPFLEIFARAQAANSIVRDLLNDHKATSNTASGRYGTMKPDLRNKDIDLDHVVFRYPARPARSVLNDLKMTIHAGKFTAIVGPSGGGKSTLVALLLGIYDYFGQILIGEHDIRSIDPEHLRSEIAVVDQDATLLPGSIFDNVCFGLRDSDMAAGQMTSMCLQALKDANVDFLDHLSQGIHTHIGNEVQLSGGQQQRVCLARALIKSPAILILDEPTSALDAGSEVAIIRAVEAVAANGTTVIMIAHRLSTTLNADNVIVMSDGHVVESGAPTELAKSDTIFRHLLDAQSTKLDAVTRTHAQLLANVEGSAPPRASSSTVKSDGSCCVNNPRLSFFAIFRRFSNLVSTDMWLIILGLLTSVIGGGILLGQVFVFGNLIELLNQSRQDPAFYDRADFFCLTFFVLGLIAFASYASSGTAFGTASARLTERVQICMLQKLLYFDISWFSRRGNSVHELMASFTKSPADLTALGGVALGSIFTILTSLIGSIILAHIVAWRIALVMLAAVPVMMFCGYVRLHLLTLAETKHREAYSKPTSVAAEAFRKRRIVTTLRLERYILDEYGRALRAPRRKVRNFIIGSNTILAFCFSTTYFIYALAYWWGSRQVRNGAYSTTEFFIVLPALLFSAQSAGQIFSLSPELARARTAARSIFEFLDCPAGIAQPVSTVKETTPKFEPSLPSLSNGQTASNAGVEIEFRNVSLRYPNSSHPSLQDASLKINRGETVAFVGPSGAGKSSAVALFERFYDPTEGTIFIDGTDIRGLDVRNLRARIGLVTQNSDLFPGTISYNIRLGAAPGQDITDADIKAVCRKCALHEFIASLPEGYNTACGSNGLSRLSGGQRQRLTIARALIRNPSLLLLDEPTSALDAHSELHVQQALAEAATGRTTVIVAHRLASIRNVDRIFVFERGRVVEQGSHTELVSQNGLYASMAKAQSLA